MPEVDAAPHYESKAAHLAAAGMGTIKKKERGKHVLAVPLICGERILGVLEGVRDSENESSFKKSEIELLDALSLPLASALANAVRIAEAERLSQTDDLTKLHNARYLRQFLLNEIRRARRYGSSVTALFLDLDDFKQSQRRARTSGRFTRAHGNGGCDSRFGSRHRCPGTLRW